MPDIALARFWLATIVCGGQPSWPFDALRASSVELVSAARQEGVVALVDFRLKRVQKHKVETCAGRIPEEVAQAFSIAAREEIFVSMVQEAESRRLLSMMSEGGLSGLFLKGSALAYWAYPEPHLRACSDVDLLLSSREAAEQLAARLRAAGYERSNTSGELVAYELMCRRHISEELQLEVDVHWRLANSPLFANAFTFDELMAESIALPKLGPHARGLGLVHACIHAGVHRALNLSIGVDDKLKWLYDLEVLMALFTPADWQRLAHICISKGLCGVVLHALQAASTTFSRRLPEDVFKALHQAEIAEPLDARRLADWRYMQRKTFQAFPTMKLRLRWVWQRIFPSMDYMRALYGEKGKSYMSLMVYRFKRVLQEVGHQK